MASVCLDPVDSLEKIEQDKNTRMLKRELPLENSWSFWFNHYIGPGCSPSDYSTNLVFVGTIDTVQGFWRWFNNLPAVSVIQPGSSIFLMKAGIKPIWEDVNNISGGHLCFKVTQNEVNNVWLGLVLNAIGEQFDSYLTPQDDICGVSVSIHKNGDAVVQIWNKNSNLINIKLMQVLMHSIVPNVKFLESPIYKRHH